jgi:hypothetical protein
LPHALLLHLTNFEFDQYEIRSELLCKFFK